MEFNFLLIALLSHNIFDFIFQGKWLLENRFPKSEDNLKELKIKNLFIKTLKGNVVHSFVHLIGLYIIMRIIWFIKGQPIFFPVKQMILIAILHFIIDQGKSLICLNSMNLKNNIGLFLIDQLLHLITITLVTFNLDITYIIQVLKDKILKYPSGLFITEKFLIFLIVFFVVTWPVGIFIKIFIGYISSNKNQRYLSDESRNIILDKNGEVIKSALFEAKNGGFIIGLLERIFILVSIVINYPLMIGFVLTVKSVARLKKLSDDSFAEYFIIGTFLSFISAVLGGIIIRSLLIN